MSMSIAQPAPGANPVYGEHSWSGQSKGHLAALACILIAYVVTTVAYNLSIPVGEAPDEPAHIEYVRVLLRTGQMPTIPVDSPRYTYEAEQPPLYYLLQAGWMRLLWPRTDYALLPELKPNPDFDPDTNFSFELGNAPNVYLHDYPPDEALPVHLMRLVSTICGLGTLLLVWGAARAAWPERGGAALLAVGLVAAIPGFAFSSATVNNDALAATAGAAVLFGCVLVLRRGASLGLAVALGVALGAGLLAKRSLLVLVPTVIVLVAIVVIKDRRDWRSTIGRALVATGLVLAGTLAVGVWPFVSNLVQYGDPLATEVTAAVKSAIGSPLEGRPGYWLSPGYFIALYNSFWGAFGIRNIDLPNLVYAGYYVLCLLAVISLVRFRRQVDDVERAVLWTCLAAVLLVNIGVAYQNTQYWAVQGRLLLPAVAAVALPVGLGLALAGGQFLPEGRARYVGLGVFLGALVAVELYVLAVYVIRAYGG
jgi:4-amino-4-deoxy-L-arabinose transferase-like glycosyltransferase